jgi:ABC-type glycerol-3-phosphate transport system substrate-binding protein
MRACRAGAVLAMLVALAACAGSGSGAAEGEWVTPAPGAEDGGAEITITGTVTHLQVEGGFYAIRGDDGVTYDPTNLPPQFQKDGLEVEAEARRRDDMMGIHQAGPIVQLVRIRAR